MSRELRFWRNVILIGLAHVAVLAGLVRWGGTTERPRMDVMWMAATVGTPGAARAKPMESPIPVATPAEEPQATLPPPAEEPPASTMTPAESMIPLPTATPRPTPSPVPKPTPSATPRNLPTKEKKPKAAEKTPAPTPEKKKKKPSPAPASTPAKKSSPAEKKTATVAVDPMKEGSAGSAGAGGGAAGGAQFSWYGNMLHNRFFGAWAQPTAASATGGKMSALVQLRIEKDGRVSDFRIVRSSGNVVVDESVAAVGKRVLKVDPLPAGLAASGHYDVRIKFELDVE